MHVRWESLVTTYLFCCSKAMSPEELVYLGILAASIPAGFLLRYLSEYFGNLKCSTKNQNTISCDVMCHFKVFSLLW